MVQPAVAYLQIDGGQEKNLLYTLTNRSQQTVRVTLEVASFRPDGISGALQLEPVCAFPYIAFTDGEPVVILQPNETRAVSVTVAPPLGVAVREYPLTLLFTMAPETTETVGSEVNLQVGSNLIVRTDANNIDLSNLSLRVDGASSVIDSWSQPKVQIVVDNWGDFGTLIAGTVTLKRSSGEVVAQWSLYNDLILGQSSRRARALVGEDNYERPILIDDLPLGNFLLGSYVLEATVVSGHPAADPALETVYRQRILALPYWLLLFLLVLSVIVWLMRRRGQKKRRQARAQKTQAKLKARRQYFDEL